MPVGQTGEKHINNPGDSMYYDPMDDACFKPHHSSYMHHASQTCNQP